MILDSPTDSFVNQIIFDERTDREEEPRRGFSSLFG